MLALSLHEWWVITTAMVLLPGVALLLHMVGYRRTKAFMDRLVFVRSIRSNEVELENGHVIAKMIAVAAAHGVYHANCLNQSLVVWWMLARRHTHSEIRFGVPKLPQDSFEAHAWVECNGEALGGSLELNQQLRSLGN